VPSSFLMEMPREEIELTQASLPAEDWSDPAWEEQSYQDEQDFDDDSFDVATGNPSTTNRQPLTNITTNNNTNYPLATAAQWSDSEASTAAAPPQVSPDAFAQGMAVLHPKHGLGKIVALSGAGKNRRATVRFATASEKRFVLAHSPLRPAGR